MNYTIKCNTLGEKKEFIQICGKIELRNKFYYKGDLYELQTFYHRRTLLSTRILCKGKKLSGNRKTSRQKREFGFQRITEKLYILPRRSEILSVYGAKEKQLAKQLPPPRNVLETRDIGIHRREAVANVVSRTNIQNAVRDEDAVIQDDLPLDR